MSRWHARAFAAVVASVFTTLLACRGVLGIDYRFCGADCDAATVDASDDGEAPDAGDAGPEAIYRINCGGPAVGGFADDIPNCAYCGGPNSTTWYTVEAGIDMTLVDATPMAVYQDYRWNRYDAASGLGQYFSYRFPGLVPGQTYDVRLHFADIWNDAAGQRQFNVNVNGKGVLFDFDIIQQAGAPFKAIDRRFDATADATGQIEVDFVATNSHDGVACVSGIEVWTRVLP